MNNTCSEQQLTGMAGVFLTVGRLFKRGYQASVTFGNAKGLDVMVYNPRTERLFSVEVKTLRERNCFQIKRENLKKNHIYVFIVLHEDDSPEKEEYFIVPGSDIRNDINKFFGSSYRDPNKRSTRPAINYGSLAEYEDKWQVFDK